MTLPGHVIAGAYPAYPCPRREVKTQGRLHQPRHLINALPSARIVNYPALGQARWRTGWSEHSDAHPA